MRVEISCRRCGARRACPDSRAYRTVSRPGGRRPRAEPRALAGAPYEWRWKSICSPAASDADKAADQLSSRVNGALHLDARRLNMISRRAIALAAL